MSCWVLVPIKPRRQCKTRLAAVLSGGERLTLVRRMLARTLDTLQSVLPIDHVAVVSAERDQVPESIEVIPELGHELNSSLTAAMAYARNRGATTILILHSDLPALQESDVEALLEGAEQNGLAIAPDDRREGTNAVCLPAHLNLPLEFGAHSFRAHLLSARDHGYRPAVVESAGLGFDLDSSADLKHYRESIARLPEALVPSISE